MSANPAIRNRDVVERFLAGTHSPGLAGLDVIDETVSPAIVCHGFPGGDPVDHDSYKAFFRTFQSAFSDMAFQVHAIVADAQFVSARFRVTCRHTADFAGVVANGAEVVFDGMVLYRMEDGLIAETWLHLDQLALLSQIGALPALAA